MRNIEQLKKEYRKADALNNKADGLSKNANNKDFKLAQLMYKASYRLREEARSIVKQANKDLLSMDI